MTEKPVPGIYYVQVVVAKRGGVFEKRVPVRYNTIQSAKAAAEDLQESFDAQCLPRRAYVLDKHNMPLHAAGQRRVPPGAFLTAAHL